MEDLYSRNEPFVISFVSSCSGAGKTTLIEKIIEILGKKGYKVGALKHDAHKFEIDKPGKDSWRFSQAGAENVIISSKDKLAMVMKLDNYCSVEAIVKMFKGSDIVIVEGFKTSNYPKIEVHRKLVSQDLLFSKKEYEANTFLAIATDESVDGIYNLDINNPSDIAGYIESILIKNQIDSSEDNFNLNYALSKDINEVINLNNGDIKIIDEKLIVEHELILKIKTTNEEFYQTFYCTPSSIKELIVGNLLSSGLIKSKDEIVSLEINNTGTYAKVEVCSKLDYKSDEDDFDSLLINPNLIFESMHMNLCYSKLFCETGGAHCIGYLNKEKYLGAFEDVGRHNALDKLIGHLNLTNKNPSEIAIITSGRLSQDMVVKCINAKIKMIITKSAPTSMAYELCKKNDITLIGFVRKNRLNVYHQGNKLQIFNKFTLYNSLKQETTDTIKNTRVRVLKETLFIKNN